jgi:outer membrane protein insertion porin family
MLPVQIDEGAPTRIRTVHLRGARSGQESAARAVLGLEPGATVTPEDVRQARIRLEQDYRKQGYREAHVSISAQMDSGRSELDVTVGISQGPAFSVRDLRIEGVQSTRPSLVRAAVKVEPGAAASPTAASDTERGLYELGVFRTVTVHFQPVDAAAIDTSEVAVDAVVAVQESQRYRLRFGLETSSEYQPAIEDRTNSIGFAVDLRDRNFLGRAMSLGVGVRYEPTLESVRTLLAIPRTRRVPVRTNLYGVLRLEEDTDASARRFRDDTTEFTIEQRTKPRRWLDLAWGYNLSWRDVRLIEPQHTAPRGRSVGALASTFGIATIDRRDSPLDPTRGWLLSSSAQWGIPALGSSARYVRLLLRSSVAVPLGPVVVASTARLGWLGAWTGTPGVNAEDLLFKAGGTQSVRGYAQDALSAIEFAGVPLGGTRVLVLGQEIRFPMFWRLGGVLFTDAGNTFFRGGIDLADLAVGTGFGLRVRTPLAPIRIDLGFPLPQGDGRLHARWHFSIGQMF